MARKKKNKGGGILFLVLILFALVIVITPFVLIFGLLNYLIKVSEYLEKIKGDFSDFWLNDEEKAEFKQYADRYFEIEEKLEEVNKQVEEHNIAKNKDNTISRRSKLGKKLRAIVEELEPKKYELQVLISELIELPKKRWNEFNKSLKLYNAFKKSIIIWLLSLIGVGIYFKKFPWQLLKGYYSIVAYFFQHKDIFGSWEFHALSLVTLITWAGFAIFYFSNSNPANKYTPEPPEVDYSNVDDY